jgi:hypothetical protein
MFYDLTIIEVKNSFIKIFRLGKVAHACNPRYLGNGDWEDHG